MVSLALRQFINNSYNNFKKQLFFMADTRRDFIKKATLLTGYAGLFSVLPGSIQKALAINADKGTTYLDAEHIVFLMQENRSFDHCYGTLQGVRGFDDPRAMRMPDLNTVWLQRNKMNETYIPFNLDIKNSKATWMQSLPHSWENQVDAHNNGAMDGWLESKRSGDKDYAHMPLTMGYYDRKDIPFYYALADAFTVCDQNFCSSLTGTSANRSYFWAGTIREEQNAQSRALVFNDEINFRDLSCKTFPERMEEAGVSWKVYQNELSIETGFVGEEGSWLSNFADNNLEFYKQYNVKLHKAHLEFLPKKIALLEKEISELQQQTSTPAIAERILKKKVQLEKGKKEQDELAAKPFDKLTDFEKSIHQRAFVTNIKDPNYRQLTTFTYKDGNEERQVAIPKGDTLYQFRQDVKNGRLPTVSWLAAPGNFSDHPTSPWYGAWYVSEVMDILTQNPEIWKKTIFILNYDENDGYFDHVAPFVPPITTKPETGICSEGIDTAVEHVTAEDEANRPSPASRKRVSPIGLGFRVPMVIASPWTRGGWVNSEVFDHTSCLRFLEVFLSKKTGKQLKESNISEWRRTVCGDLTSVFRPYNGEKISYPSSLKLKNTVQHIHQAKFKPLPGNFKSLSPEDIAKVNKDPKLLSTFPRQEKGTRFSCALPYELHANGVLNKIKNVLTVSMKSGLKAGVPFNVNGYGLKPDLERQGKAIANWFFAVKPGDELTYDWSLDSFEYGNYQIELLGPNGFLRGFNGDENDPDVFINVNYTAAGNIEILAKNSHHKFVNISIKHKAYQLPHHNIGLEAGKHYLLPINLHKCHHWYDLYITIEGYEKFGRSFAGRVETAEHGYTDPQIGSI
ncbi:phospholipase C [Pedobacter sp. ok626]|nr:phospholipase C [Pedobacter sp. ok626]